MAGKKMLVNRYLVVTVMTCCVALAVHFIGQAAFENTAVPTGNIAGIPESFGRWKGTDVRLDEQVYQILETRSIVHRNYRSTAGDVFLSIVYYPENKVDFHAPEGCLAGKGIQVSKSIKEIRVAVQGEEREIKVNQLTRRNGEAEELIYYFYKAGDFMGENYIRLRCALVFNRFFSNRPSGALIRVSTTLGGKHPGEGTGLLTEFIEGVYPYLIRYL